MGRDRKRFLPIVSCRESMRGVMGANSWTLRLLWAALVLAGVSSSASCGSRVSPESSGTQFLSIPSGASDATASTSVPGDAGQVYAAQIRGQWAPGYPYPVFFLDLPVGTSSLLLREVVYQSEQEPLGGSHPQLEKVVQTITWPDATTAVVAAENFTYDEAQGVLLSYSASLDGIPLDTASRDLFAAQGVGISFLGDTGGVNVFHNCSSGTTIDYEELASDEHGRPTAANFQWQCEADSYDMHVEVVWGRSDPHYDIAVIIGLSATITRGSVAGG